MLSHYHGKWIPAVLAEPLDGTPGSYDSHVTSPRFPGFLITAIMPDEPGRRTEGLLLRLRPQVNISTWRRLTQFFLQHETSGVSPSAVDGVSPLPEADTFHSLQA